MAAGIKIEGFEQSNIKEQTSLAADAAAAATSLVVESVQGIVVNDWVLVGSPGVEQSEIRQVTAIAGTTLTVAALTYAHRRGMRVAALVANKLRIYKATNVDGTVPADGSFALLATIDIDPDNIETYSEDPLGGSGYWYKSTFYRSDTSTETALADSIPARGADYGHYVFIDEVRREAGFAGVDILPDSVVDTARVAAESEVDGALAQAGYDLPMSVVPDILRQITKLLAAGFLLNQESGLSTTGGDNPGDSRIAWAEKMLEQIRTNELALINPLTKEIIEPTGDGTDADGVSGGGRVGGFPDADPDPKTGEPVRAFTRKDEY